MKFTRTKLPGAWVIELEPREDERGFLARTFCEDEFADHGLHRSPPQGGYSLSARQRRPVQYEAWTCRSAETIDQTIDHGRAEYERARYEEQHVEPEQDWRELVGEIHQHHHGLNLLSARVTVQGLCPCRRPARPRPPHVTCKRTAAPGSCALLSEVGVRSWLRTRRESQARSDGAISMTCTSGLQLRNARSRRCPNNSAQAPPMMVAFKTYGPIGLIA